jgi:hypothetical protein
MRQFIHPSALVPQEFVFNATHSTETETIMVIRHASHSSDCSRLQYPVTADLSP